MTLNGDGVRVTPSALELHASHVQDVADQVRQARQAGETTRPSPDAYGYLCAIVPIFLGQLHDQVLSVIDEADRSLDDTQQRLRKAADLYRAAEEHAVTRLQRIRAEL